MGTALRRRKMFRSQKSQFPLTPKKNQENLKNIFTIWSHSFLDNLRSRMRWCDGRNTYTQFFVLFLLTITNVGDDGGHELTPVSKKKGSSFSLRQQTSSSCNKERKRVKSLTNDYNKTNNIISHDTPQPFTKKSPLCLPAKGRLFLGRKGTWRPQPFKPHQAQDVIFIIKYLLPDIVQSIQGNGFWARA